MSKNPYPGEEELLLQAVETKETSSGFGRPVTLFVDHAMVPHPMDGTVREPTSVKSFEGLTSSMLNEFAVADVGADGAKALPVDGALARRM